MTINFKNSMATPIAVDIGNKTTQGMTVSKTVQFGLFTTNENAVWAGKTQLQKQSFPFAVISIPVNRDMFRLQVGDCFKFSYSKYNISDMICRILQIEEDSLKSENITIHAMEDIFSATNVVTEYSDPVDNRLSPYDYELDPFIEQTVIETPFVISEKVNVIPIACRTNDLDIGFGIHMSIDGSSYTQIGTVTNIQPHGTLVDKYGLTCTIDDNEGFIIDFTNDADLIETVTWSDILSGSKNMALLGSEIISFKTIIPVSGIQYKLENIIRGRFGTQKVTHAADEDFWFVQKTVQIIGNSEIMPGVDRKFKLVPYNIRKSGDIADAIEIDLSITGLAKTPYIPVNFNANDSNFAARYEDDVVLTWNARYRGRGAGIGAPGEILPNTDREGFFRIEVFVSDVNVRDITDIDAITWTYTEAMNISDNGSLATEVVFKLYNFIVDSGVTYESDAVQVTCKKS